MHPTNFSPAQLEAALYAITSSPDVMAGEPVFRGTRVPIDIVLGSLEARIEFTLIQTSYPFITEALVDAARIYAHVRPRRGQTLRLRELYPELVPVRTTVVRRANLTTDTAKDAQHFTQPKTSNN